MTIEKIIIGTLAFILVLLIIGFIAFFVQQNKKLDLLKKEHQITKDAALKKLREQMLKNLAANILDSFGNNLLVIKLNMKLLEEVAGSLKKMAESMQETSLQRFASTIENSVMETKKTLQHMAADMIETCAQLNKDIVADSFLKNLDNELKQLDSCTVSKKIHGDEYPLGKEKEIILLYICQQVLDNVIQHSKAKKLNIFVYYSQTSFSLKLEDDGVGFHQKDLYALKKSGKGFQNMLNAAQLVNANLDIKSQLNQGTTISIDLEPLSN